MTGSRRSGPGAGSSDPEDWVGGIHPVLAALRDERSSVVRVLLASGRTDRRAGEILDLARRRGVPWSRVPRAALDRILGGGSHQGVLAEVAALPYHDREEALTAAPRPELLVVLDGVQDPANLGAILRTAAATAVGAVFLPRRRAAGLSGGVRRAAAGTLGMVPVVREPNLARLVELLEERGIACWALDRAGETPWDRADLHEPLALVAGGEASGVRRLVRDRCRGTLGLPLATGVESLNVSVALGATLYEVLRQRHSRVER